MDDVAKLTALRDKLRDNWVRPEDKEIIRQCFMHMAEDV
jgi:hypothetical protein